MNPFSNSRFSKPNEAAEYFSEYDIPSSLIQDLIQRNPEPIHVKTFSLVGAGSMIITEPGYGFAFYSYAAAKTPIQGFLSVGIMGSTPDRLFPCATNRGYVGSFNQLFLSWPDHTSLDSGAFAYFLVFKSDQFPWSR